MEKIELDNDTVLYEYVPMGTMTGRIDLAQLNKVERIKIYGDPVDERALEQIQMCVKHHLAVGGALMADHHLGYSMPIGGVVAYKDAVSPSGAGYDIGCGNKAVKLDIPKEEVIKNIGKIMDDVVARISFGIGRKNNVEVDHELFDNPIWSQPYLKDLKQKAREQLGTVGSGNHYVDIFVDEQDFVWVGVHFGSRGLGHSIATYFLKEAGSKGDGMMSQPTVLTLASEIGSQYWEAMSLAGDYAYAGRDWVCEEVSRILGANPIDSVHNHHNYCWKEQHGGEELIVVRKGATPAFPGQRGFVGGSMGDVSVIVEGVDSPEATAIYNSTVHGAGRVLSRTQAAGKMNYKTKKRQGGCVTPQMMMDWVQEAGVTLRGAGTDESPQAYKRLPEVLAHHSDSIKVLHTLTPIGVAMAGENEYDPYKD